MSKTKQQTGTREWSNFSLNCAIGCSHNCRYCYAREMLCRFGVTTEEEWPVEKLKKDVPLVRHRKGVIMFPTAHDITLPILDQCCSTIYDNLTIKNRMLICSKPKWSCMREIFNTCSQYKDIVEIRFTIGSLNDDALYFWEPGAPSMEERYECLKQAKKWGFHTSVSIEPILEPWYVEQIVDEVGRFVNGQIWIGLLRKSEQRVRIEDEDGELRLKELEEFYKTQAMKDILEKVSGYPNVMLKDSARRMLVKNGDTKETTAKQN